jgi:hypothetical protein
MSKPRCPTDKELAAAVEKITAAVNENVPRYKAALPDLVRMLSDDEWTKLKRDENRRRQRMK